MANTTITLSLPEGVVAELERLAQETGRSKDYYARSAILEFLEDRADYMRAVEVLESENDQPNLTLEEVKRELGPDD